MLRTVTPELIVTVIPLFMVTLDVIKRFWFQVALEPIAPEVDLPKYNQKSSEAFE